MQTSMKPQSARLTVGLTRALGKGRFLETGFSVEARKVPLGHMPAQKERRLKKSRAIAAIIRTGTARASAGIKKPPIAIRATTA